jgi:hypothetical protein
MVSALGTHPVFHNFDSSDRDQIGSTLAEINLREPGSAGTVSASDGVLEF